VRVISPKRLRQFWQGGHANSEAPLKEWLKLTEHAWWSDITDLRGTFPHADAVGVKSGRFVTVFNVGGNAYRLIAAVHYNTQIVYVLRVMTHAEYDKDKWKGQL